MKLINTGERFDVVMPNGFPQRGHQLAELLPQLINSITYRPNLTYKIIMQRNIMRQRALWRHIKESQFYLEANTHLEAGKRIENFLPDLPTTYTLPYVTNTNADKYPAGLVAIYTSAYSNARHWNLWGASEWNKLLDKLGKQYILIGAPYDVGIDLNRPDVISSVGEPLPVVIEILKKSKYFIGFPSGLSIIGETLGAPNFMHYPAHLNKMVSTWADPARIASGEYIGRVGASVEEVYELVKGRV